ncbi:hypothetical protein NKG05_06250 [Oerskovia sp. M15]
MRDAVRAMAHGQAITLAPHDTVLTTQGLRTSSGSRARRWCGC